MWPFWGEGLSAVDGDQAHGGRLADSCSNRGMATVREADGLAMSSRNGYLTVEERAKAPVVYQVLTQTAEALQAGDQDFKSLEESAWNSLENAGLRPDYFQIRRAQDLQSPDKEEKDLVILAAAYLGAARLIDNKTVTNR